MLKIFWFNFMLIRFLHPLSPLISEAKKQEALADTIFSGNSIIHDV